MRSHDKRSRRTLMVQAALETDRRKATQEIMLDPLTAAIMPPREIEAMVDKMFANQAGEVTGCCE